MNESKKSMDFEALGDFCKAYEHPETSRKPLPGMVLMARLDGRAFHTLTKHFNRPFDEGFVNVMTYCSERLMAEFHADFAYTQSDEISLCWYLKNNTSQFPFDGKFHKLNSILAAACSVEFNRQYLGTRLDKPGLFDCRTWSVPNLETATRGIMWRQWDAERNSINMLAHHVFGTKKLQGVGTNERLQMLEKEGVIWGNLEDRYKSGTFCFSQLEHRLLNEEELAEIPEQHRPAGLVARNRVINRHTRLRSLPDPIKYLFPNYNNE